MSAVIQGWTYSDGNLQWRLPAFKTSWHYLDKTQVCASHITRPSNDIIVLCCSVGTRLYFTIISHCGLSDPPGWLMPSYAFKRLQTSFTKRSTDCHTMKKKKKRISETIMHTVNSRTQWEIILMLLFCSLFSSRPLLIHFRERTSWQMGYFFCSCPPTLIAATHPYRPGGHMCYTPPWRSARKGHGDVPDRSSLVSNATPNMDIVCNEVD